VTELGLREVRALPPNAVLFTCIGSTIGKMGITSIRCATNQQINSVVVNADNCAEFIYYQLLHNASTIKRIAGTQAIPIISKGLFQQQQILVPERLEEQRRIAEILSTWDRAIEATEKLIAGSQAQKKALMQQLLTGKKRLPGFSDVPDIAPLTEVARIVTGSSNREDSLDQGAYLFFDRSTDIRRSDRYIYDTEAVIVGGEGQEFIPKYYFGKFDLHQRAYAIIDFKGVLGKYIYYVVHQHRALLKRYSVGSTVSSLRMGSFEKVPVRRITLSEQEKIIERLMNADRTIEAFQCNLRALMHQKSALMQQLLTGKRRVTLPTAQEGVV
jgi:type I restriction enzyme S subunit